MQRKQLVYILAIVALLVAALPAAVVAAPSASPLQQGESPDTLIEQAKALDAEQNPTSPESVPQYFPGGAGHPLFIGVDDVTVPAYRVDVVTNDFMQAFVGFQVWGSAYDPVNDKVYFNNGSTLYEWPVGGAVASLGTITDPAGATQAITGLAFYNGTLYGVKNIANEAIWAIDTTTLVATVFIDYVDADLDCGGFSADPNSGTFYCTNDDSTPHGTGLKIINPDASVTSVAPYPAGQTDIDGLAVSDDGFAYLVTDEPGFIYVYDLVGGAYVAPLTNPWTTSEVFSGGAYIAATPPLEPVCQTPQLTIPDNTPAGVSTTITVPSGGSLTDLDFSTNTTHTWVGDLIYTLEHVDTGTTVTLIDRPGVPGSTFGCSGDNINATINDEGVDGNVETTCLGGVPTIAGDLVGGDPANTSLLAAFDGESFAGDWTLTVSDNAAGDTGIVNEWCLIPGEPAGDPPNIFVDPLSMASTQAPDVQVQQTLTISNTGGGTLDWTIDEEDTTLPTIPPVTLVPQPAAEVVGAPEAAAPAAAPAKVAEWRAPAAVLYDNGGMVTHLGGGFGGADASALQTAIGLNVYGFGHAVTTGFRLADDFTVPAGGWNVDSITFFAYQTGSTTASTINAVNLRIWDGPPNAGGQVIWGDTTTNVMTGSTWSNIYRSIDTDLQASNRPIMADVAAVGTFLPAGTYWVDWQSGGTLASGPWAPPVTILGQVSKPGSNALQFDGAAWNALIDTGTAAAPQDLPFIIEGTAGGGEPCMALSDIAWLSLAPTNGSNGGGTDTDVTVTFDSTGLVPGVYTGNLCVTSNDPDTGPGNETDQVIVPVTLTVLPPTAVALTNLSAGVEQMPAPLAGLPLAALPAAVAAALGAAFVWRRQRD